MSSITLRIPKGSPLSFQEADDNFNNLNTDKYEAGSSPSFVTTTTEALKVTTSGTPASAAATGAAGTILWDSNYIYVCVAANTWKRVAISTW